jgi:hypothetical protein
MQLCNVSREVLEVLEALPGKPKLAEASYVRVASNSIPQKTALKIAPSAGAVAQQYGARFWCSFYL